MTATRWLFFVAALGTLGGLALLLAFQPADARQGRAPDIGGGVHGSVFVRAPARPATKGQRDQPIPLPDFELALKNVATGTLSAPQKTDLFGRFVFPPQKQGTYRLVWKKQNGWDEGEYPKKIVVTRNTQYPGPVEIRPQKGLVVLTGRVRLRDGSSPWYVNEFFGVRRAARVELSGAGEPARSVRANFAGDFAIAAQPKPKARVQASSQAAKATIELSADHFKAKEVPRRLDLTLDNHRPQLAAVVAQRGGQAVRHAPLGATVKLVALASDPDRDTLRYVWKVDAGKLTGDGAAIDWQLPRQPGVHTAHVLVSDGRGGDVHGQVSVTVGAKGDLVSGRATDTSGKPVARADVIVNDQKTVTDPDGSFRVVVPLANRYILNIRKAGFAPLSRVFDRPTNGHIWKLVPAQVSSVDPAKAIDLVDRRPILEKRKLKGARVQVPAGALVDAAGKKPVGKLSATVATLDLSNNEAPGDWIAKEGARDVGLISYGLAFIEFTDAAGKKYNLAPGQKATVTIPIPASLLARAPAQMAMWSYDEKDGYWKSLGTAATLNKAAAAYQGQVPHFSTINMDQTGPVSCVRVFSDISIPTGLKLRVSSPSFPTVKEVVLDGPLNAIYRIPANTKVKLEVLDATGVLLPNVIVENGNTTGAIGTPLPNNTVTAGPADPNLWPPFPYANCKPVTLKLNALWSGYPNSPFLSFKNLGNESDAITKAYYDRIDPQKKRRKLADWWAVNGFNTSGVGPTGPNYARTSYLNNNDLGSGRDMHFLRHADGTLAAYVTNYSRGGKFDQNPIFADDALAQNQPGATVCMEYAPIEGDPAGTKIVKFFVFAKAGLTLQNHADLDGFGEKFVPNLCLHCHGGSYYNSASPTLADVNMESSFRELDVSTYKFPGFRTTPNAAEQAAFKKQNQLIRATSAARKPILDLIDNWYLPGGMGATQDNSYTPINWKGLPQQTLYHDVVKVSCRTCHIAFVSDDDAGGTDWNRYDQFKARRVDSIPPFTIGTSISGIPGNGIRVMPHGLVTYRNFWLDQNPAHRPRKLWEYKDLPDWPPIGAPAP
jgi:hypothetical protein